MSNLVWIHDSVRILKKLQVLFKVLGDDTLFIAATKQTAEVYKSKSIPCRSLEEVLQGLETSISIVECEAGIAECTDHVKHLIISSAYKRSFLSQGFSEICCDAQTEIGILLKCWSLLINRSRPKVFILNGMSLAAYSLAITAHQLKLQVLYWENGLLPNSLFIDHVGVNSYCSIAFNAYNLYNESRKLIDKHFLARAIGPKLSNALVTLQVDHDTNIKCSSPFFSNVDFIYFLAGEIAGSCKQATLRLRAHPKEPFKILSETLFKTISSQMQLSEADVDISSEIAKSDLVITINSTTGFEAIVSERPALFFGNSVYSHYFLLYSLRLSSEYEISFGYYDPNDPYCKSQRSRLLSDVLANSIILDDDIDSSAAKINICIENSRSSVDFLGRRSSDTFPFFRKKRIYIHSSRFSVNNPLQTASSLGRMNRLKSIVKKVLALRGMSRA